MITQFQLLQGSSISAVSQYLIHTSTRTSTLMISCSIRPRRDIVVVKNSKTPARDRVIEFGKHKGKMLGTLPSTYLKWVSNNLRAGDFQEWANMADQVLNDPVYKDRIEWEFAHKVLNGDRILPSDDVVDGAVPELLEISKRFGWDNEDNVGWSKIDFGLLGTSKGGRIPRRLQENIEVKLGNGTEGRELNLRRLNHNEEEEEATSGGETRRDMRRERLKLKMRGGLRMDKTGTSSIGFGLKCDEEEEENNQMMFERRRRMNQEEEEDRTVENYSRSRFPGRQSLLNKVLNSRRTASNRKGGSTK